MQHLVNVAALDSDARRGARLRGKFSDGEIESLGAEGAKLSEDQAVADAMAV